MSLNIKKTKYIVFQKNSVKDDIPLKLAELKIAQSFLRLFTSLLLALTLIMLTLHGEAPMWQN